MANEQQNRKPVYVSCRIQERARRRVQADAVLQNRDGSDVISEACEVYADVRADMERKANLVGMTIPEAIIAACEGFDAKKASRAA